MTDDVTEKAVAEVGVDVRMCKDCRTTVFSRSDFAASLAHKPPDVKAYENLVQFERGIRLMLPKFQRLLMVLQCVLGILSTFSRTYHLQRSRKTPIISSAGRRF